MTRSEHAIVLGGGWAGMLAAQALSRRFDAVTVLERDVLPEGPRQRKGQPQARHGHILWSSGARVVDALLPGTIDRLLSLGARRIMFQRDLVTLTSHGWQHRFPSKQYCVMCSRPLMDWAVREQVAASGRVEVRQRTEALDLAGDRDRITGVHVRDVATGAASSLTADLVVDATGRGSRLKHWLGALGLPPLEEDVVDAGMAYCSRIYQAPPGAAAGFPPVNLAPDPRVREPGRFGVVHPQEDGTWMVTLAGTRGVRLPTDDAEFNEYARTLRDPLVADLIARAEPLTPLVVSHFGANRRLYPERLAGWPDRLVVLGDALAVFNPIYGHGMSAAARGIAALDERLAEEGLGAGAVAAAQRDVCAAVDDPWIIAAARDIEYVGCRSTATDPRLLGEADARRRFADVITVRSLRSPGVSEMVTDAASLAVPQSELGSSRFMALLGSDPMRPELTEPPLSPDELALVNLSPRAAVGAETASG
ncbi:MULTISPECIES: NAD(P)/FAD-dependent oxidoreductase [Actinomadura]|uniref:NAD(P)/FAD-dependent oxidoreductase n=1 Tax=Actinomadura yumaensis TaxID=111807 RepID=A0ABW2CIM1_9ACTN|nr:FAD-dependent monooxygenase [Actinomadura sp. J1-007]MWK40673.1 epoxidase [Actinomadura sp. J1-007]